MKRLFSILALVLIISILLCSCDKHRKTETTTTTGVTEPVIIAFDYLSLNMADYVSLPPSAFNSFSVYLNADDYKVTDGDVTERIQELQSANLANCPSYTESKDRASVAGDFVSFYYTIYVDGVSYYTNVTDAKPARIKVGTGIYMDIEGFEEGLIGLTPNTMSLERRTEGSVGPEDVVYFTYACTYYDHDGKLISSEAKDKDRIDLTALHASYGASFASNLAGAQIGEQTSFTIHDDFDGDGEPESKTYEGKVLLATRENCRTIEGRFPKGYAADPSLAEKNATIEVMVMSVDIPVYPELTAEFITDTLKFNTDSADVIGEFKKQIKADLEAMAQIRKRSDAEQKILDSLVSSMTLKAYPQGSEDFYYTPQYEEYKSYFRQDYEYNEWHDGYSPYENVSEYIAYVNDLPEGTDGEAWLLEQCRRTIKENLVVYYLADILGIPHDRSTLLDYCSSISDQVYENLGTRYSAEYILNTYGEKYIASIYIYSEVMEYCYARATVNC